jgi:hypothetical protein
MPQATSTTSMPRWTSPAASGTTLPCSAAMISASSWRWRWSRARNANITRARFTTGVPRHAGKAARAARTAASTSSPVAKATWALCRPVAGS